MNKLSALTGDTHPEPVWLLRLVGGVMVVLAFLGLTALGSMALCAGLMLAGWCPIPGG